MNKSGPLCSSGIYNSCDFSFLFMGPTDGTLFCWGVKM